MSHDPYCPLREHEVDHTDTYWCDESCEVDCQCDMIALVREDMRDCDAHGDTIRYRCQHYQQGRKDGYAAALRYAVEAVKSEWAKSRNETGDPPLRMQVVTAIETLGGER